MNIVTNFLFYIIFHLFTNNTQFYRIMFQNKVYVRKLQLHLCLDNIRINNETFKVAKYLDVRQILKLILLSNILLIMSLDNRGLLYVEKQRAFFRVAISTEPSKSIYCLMIRLYYGRKTGTDFIDIRG